ncbi:hypothetical protein LguiA_032131 [Lonicera macranthoides]
MAWHGMHRSHHIIDIISTPSIEQPELPDSFFLLVYHLNSQITLISKFVHIKPIYSDLFIF